MNDDRGFAAPTDVLPHRAPFLFVDTVTDLDPGSAAKGRWDVTGDEHFLAGHFPGRPTVPGVVLVEAIAQLGAYALLAGGEHPDKLPLFGGVDRVRFRRQVVPGDRVDLEVTLGRMSARAGRGSGRAIVSGRVAAEAELLFVLVDAAPASGTPR